jgi:hypothetical protein
MQVDLQLKQTLINTPTSVAPTPPSPTANPSPQTTATTQTNVSSSNTSSNAAITITSDRSLDNLQEGDKVQFKALQGTRDVTTDYRWVVQGSIEGNIGVIGQTGYFIAQLSGNLPEFGSGDGLILVTDKISGQVIKSTRIHVNAAIPTGLSTQG